MKTIYALGFFDGVHIGHQALLEKCRCLALKTGCRTGVITFDTHPLAFLTGKNPGLLTTAEDRDFLLHQRFAMETVVILPFRQVQSMPWRDFLSMMVQSHEAAGFVCGDDFRFGRKGEGNAALLEMFCREHQLPFAMVPEQTLEGVRVSSTHIRRLLEAGQVEEANRFLGHPHILSGTVKDNAISIPELLICPREGRYLCRVAGAEIAAQLKSRKVFLQSSTIPDKKWITLEILRQIP